MKYYLPDYGEGVGDAQKVSSSKAITPSDFAVDAAEHYHAECGGWESTWPITFAIIDDDMKELGRYEIDRECVAQFFHNSM